MIYISKFINNYISYKVNSNILIIIFTCFITSSISSQFYGRKHQPLMELNGIHAMNGWFISPGTTFMLPNTLKFLGYDESTGKPKGRLGLYLEFGRYNIFPEGGAFFNYMDYSFAYKRLSGSLNKRDKIFRQNYLLGNFNINNIIQLSDKTFIQNSLGANLDFKLWERSSDGQTNQRLLFSFHYKIGYGIKFTKTIFIIPSIETPILNVKQWEKAKSTYGLFYNRYRPIIISFRILWLRQPTRGSCPPVYAHPDDKAKQDAYMMGN